MAYVFEDKEGNIIGFELESEEELKELMLLIILEKSKIC